MLVILFGSMLMLVHRRHTTTLHIASAAARTLGSFLTAPVAVLARPVALTTAPAAVSAAVTAPFRAAWK